MTMNDNGRKADGQKDPEVKKEGRDAVSRRRRRSGRRAGDAGASHTWLVSFTDVMALMLTFFVLLFAMSKPEAESWSDVSTALQREFNRFYGAALNRGTQDTLDPNRINFDRALNITYLKALIEAVVNENSALSVVTLIPQGDHLIVSLPQDLLFARGDTNVTEAGARAIYALGGTLSRIKNKVEVIGHTDPTAIQGDGEGFSNNWELSLARAASVAGLLRSVGYEQDITIRGLSSGRYEDLTGVVDDPQLRNELARRVDVIIMNHDGVKRKVFFTMDFQ